MTQLEWDFSKKFQMVKHDWKVFGMTSEQAETPPHPDTGGQGWTESEPELGGLAKGRLW